jgi:hypothetical protein
MADFNLEHIKQFRFQQLFVDDLGWDRPAQQQPYSVAVGDDEFALDVVAHKRSVQVLHCRPDAQGRIPSYANRQKIERKVTPDAHEHLIVFTDGKQTAQVWQWVARLPGKPVQYRELHFRQGDSAELLKQKLSRLRFTLDEEELLTVMGVTARLEDAIPRDKVTKKFYAEFKKQRDAFEQFIQGIPKLNDDLHWYAAVLIDRLMFIWFLQEKQFLDGKKCYLQERLTAHGGKEQARSFYKSFLCPLFFRGFAQERTDANRQQLAEEFGAVPYLNGGLFSEHELETPYGDALDVADAALEKLFRFFDDWEWHLDDRPLKNDREINPDVLGYIFEKFVNQKQMGAYYTKEDITEYISKNTVIPALLHKVRGKHPGAFDALAWPLLQAEPDRYIYPAMRKGVDDVYPTEIELGRDTEAPELLVRRKPWNSKTPDLWALPTEIWRETIARHDRTREVRTRLAAGEVREIGDLITYNLDIRRFAQDVVERCTDVALLREFWAVLAGRVPRKSGEKFRPALSVLDPTCGSGAFLFAALNILKPLYDAALGTMAGLLLDADQANDYKSAEKWKDIEETVKRFGALGSDRARDYAVVKQIVVHNLYGVDIEEQATEIAKLRLFLKLVSLLEPGDTIEPLPDIDFNIRHGNTLVGYATADETEAAVKGATQGNLFSDAWEDIRIRLIAVEEAYQNFQIQQVQRGGHVTAQDKQALAAQLSELEEMLNFHLCRAYGKDPTKSKQYKAWKASHKPFHWYMDFHTLIAAGGFDVIVGNPPWKEYAAVKHEYAVVGYDTIDSGNLYALCTERAFQIAHRDSHIGFIVQLPLASASRMAGARKFIETSCDGLWISTFDDRPGKLFDGLQHCRSTIFIGRKGRPRPACFATSRYQRWPSEARQEMVDCIRLVNYSWPSTPEGAWPKIDDRFVTSAMCKVLGPTAKPIALHRSRSATKHFVYYQESAQYWIKAASHLPFYAKNGLVTSPSHGRWLHFTTEQNATVAAALLNSSLFYAYFVAFGDCFHVTDTLVSVFAVPDQTWHDEQLIANGKLLMLALKRGATRKTIMSRQGTNIDQIEYDEYNAGACKRIIDAIDQRVAHCFGFSQQEADAVSTFDLKFRMGGESSLVNDTDD